MKKHIVLLTIALVSVTSCLFDNDMAYPKVDSDIIAFEVEGQKEVTVDMDRKTVHVLLKETADITHLKVKTVTLSENASVSGGIPEYLDLSDTLYLNVRVYEDIQWKIYATQPISRYIKVANQIGDAEIDLERCSALVYVSDVQELTSVNFIDAKFAPEGSVIRSTTGQKGDGTLETQDCVFPMSLDCVHRRTFLVDYNGPVKNETGLKEWTVKVLKKKLTQQVTEVQPWCYHAKVYGLYSGSGTPVMEYRRSSESAWTAVSDAVISDLGITADIKGLEAGTEYVVRVGEDGSYSPEQVFVTDTPQDLYNLNFDEWFLDGKVWYPYADGANPSVWDSANKGASTFIGSSTTPEETFVVKGKAAKLESKYAVIAFAAGNIYTGEFGRVNGVGAVLDWGVPFTGRPSGLKGYYSYAPAKIDNAKEPYTGLKGQDDKCQILIMLTDWDKPFTINTLDGKFVDFDKDPGIIAFGKLESDENTLGKYKEFNVPLVYRDKTRRPKYIVIACCASYLGDYFTGGVGSTMYIDEFELIYE